VLHLDEPPSQGDSSVRSIHREFRREDDHS
jgi:hypothetical protein